MGRGQMSSDSGVGERGLRSADWEGAKIGLARAGVEGRLWSAEGE